jgi:hypothetical protein
MTLYDRASGHTVRSAACSHWASSAGGLRACPAASATSPGPARNARRPAMHASIPSRASRPNARGSSPITRALWRADGARPRHDRARLLRVVQHDLARANLPEEAVAPVELPAVVCLWRVDVPPDISAVSALKPEDLARVASPPALQRARVCRAISHLPNLAGHL